MTNLLPHRHEKEDQEVKDKDRPKDGDVHERQERAYKGNEKGLQRLEPKLEFGQAADERPELVVGALGKRRALALDVILEMSSGERRCATRRLHRGRTMSSSSAGSRLGDRNEMSRFSKKMPSA